MNIKEWILEKETAHAIERLTKLKEIGAPDIMITRQAEIAEELKAGQIKIGGNQSLLLEEAIEPTPKKGNGGKIYVSFKNGISYFPNAKYGKYIAKEEK